MSVSHAVLWHDYCDWQNHCCLVVVVVVVVVVVIVSFSFEVHIDLQTFKKRVKVHRCTHVGLNNVGISLFRCHELHYQPVISSCSSSRWTALERLGRLQRAKVEEEITAEKHFDEEGVRNENIGFFF